MNAVTYLEDVALFDSAVAVEAVLTDDQLSAGGLVKVETYIRTKSSAAATRKAAQREREAAAGVRQLNLKCSEEHAVVLKDLAAALAAGDPIEQVVFDRDPALQYAVVMLHQLQSLTGWRKWLARLLGLVKR